MEHDRFHADESESKRTRADDHGAPRAAAGRVPPLASEQVLTSREARALLKIGRTKLHQLTRRQIVPAYRIGSGPTSGLRYLRSDLIEWLMRQRIR